MTAETTAAIITRPAQPQVALVDLLDRVLAGGVVIAGDVTLSIADVELVRVSLRALVVSIRDGMCAPAGPAAHGGLA
jgi:Gas vesicle protein